MDQYAIFCYDINTADHSIGTKLMGIFEGDESAIYSDR